MSHKIAAVVIDDATIPSIRSAVAWSTIGVEPTFARDAAEASARADATPFDALIASASPAGRTAIELFAGRHPRVARVLIAPGAISEEGNAHYVVGLPLESAKVLDGISAAMRLRGGVERTRLGQLVERARHLPSLPEVYLRLQEEIRSDDPAVARVAALIEQDPAMSVKILQLINSPFMGLRREVADVKLAATLIGLQRLAALVMATGVFKPVNPLDRRLVEQLWQDSLTVGGIARRIADSEGLDSHAVDEAQLAGLLHDIGELVLFQNWREEFMQIDPVHRARDEVRVFGATHADISGYLCSAWGLSRTVVDAVTAHHNPAAHPTDDGVGAVTAVHVARALVDADMDLDAAQLDRDHLAEVGALDRLPHWLELVTAQATTS